MSNIERKFTGGPYSDATSSFTIIIKKSMTIRDFIINELNSNEWGSIYYLDDKIAEYEQGNNINFFIAEDSFILNKILKENYKIKANGGWSAMNYYFENAIL